jgi:hypothetical protein
MARTQPGLGLILGIWPSSRRGSFTGAVSSVVINGQVTPKGLIFVP